MSRFDCCDWEGEGPPPEFWQQAVKNALRGRKGQAVLRELREAMRALPKPRLIEGSLCREGEVCALGALAGHRFANGKTFTWGADLIASLPQLEERLGEDLDDETTTIEIGEAMGLKRALAWGISYENDEGSMWNETPEKRYQRVLLWVEQNLAQEVSV